MLNPQIIKAPNGEELIILPRAEYEALVDAAGEAVEMAADVAIYDARKADLAAGRDAVLPAEVSAAMLRGDSLLKALRKWRGISQTDLSNRTGFAQGYLSDLESGRRQGPPATLRAIADALEIDAAWIVADAEKTLPSRGRPVLL
jgi:Helix-turn-helix